MGLLDRIASQRAGAEVRSDNPTNNLSELLRRREAAVDVGVSVDMDSANTHGAVFACRDLICRLVSTLPVHEFDRSGGFQRQLPTPQVLTTPDGELDISAWLYQELDSLLMAGNAYGLIQRYDNRGWPAQITTVHPSSVSWQRKGKYGPVDWKLEGEPIGKWPAGDLWHLPAYTVAGLPVGLSPIRYAALTIGLGLAAQRFGGQWFRDGMIPSGLLTNEDEVPKELAELVKVMWRDTLAGNREPVVLGDGWKYEAISISPEESQFLDTIQANKADVCMWFGLDPEAIGATRAGGSSVVYQNVEQSEIHLLVRTMNPWVVRLERALTMIRPRPRYVKFNVDALLRVDAMTRAKIYDMGVRGGTLMPDEVRGLEEREPLPNELGRRALWPPGRMQLDEYELKLGADTDPADEPLPPPAPVVPPAPDPESDEQDDEPIAVGTNGQNGAT